MKKILSRKVEQVFPELRTLAVFNEDDCRAFIAEFKKGKGASSEFFDIYCSRFCGEVLALTDLRLLGKLAEAFEKSRGVFTGSQMVSLSHRLVILSDDYLVHESNSDVLVSLGKIKSFISSAYKACKYSSNSVSERELAEMYVLYAASIRNFDFKRYEYKLKTRSFLPLDPLSGVRKFIAQLESFYQGWSEKPFLDNVDQDVLGHLLSIANDMCDKIGVRRIGMECEGIK